MKIVEVHIDLVNDGTPLLAFARLLLSGVSPDVGHQFSMALSGLKVISGHTGMFVAMPDRRLTRRCLECKGSVAVVSRYCQWCAAPQPPLPPGVECNRTYADIAFPPDQVSRDYLHKVVMDAYFEARWKAGYDARPDIPASG